MTFRTMNPRGPLPDINTTILVALQRNQHVSITTNMRRYSQSTGRTFLLSTGLYIMLYAVKNTCLHRNRSLEFANILSDFQK